MARVTTYLNFPKATEAAFLFYKSVFRYLGSDEKLSPILPHRWLAALMQHGENDNVRINPGEVDRIGEFLAQRPADRLEALRIGFRLFFDSFEDTVNLCNERPA